MRGLIATRTYVGTYNVRTPVRTSFEESRFASALDGPRSNDPEFLTMHVLMRLRETAGVLERATGIDIGEIKPEDVS